MATAKQLAALAKGRAKRKKKLATANNSTKKTAAKKPTTKKKTAKKAVAKKPAKSLKGTGTTVKKTTAKKTVAKKVPSYDIYVYNAAGNPKKPQREIKGISIVVAYVKAVLTQGATQIVIDKNSK